MLHSLLTPKCMSLTETDSTSNSANAADQSSFETTPQIQKTQKCCVRYVREMWITYPDRRDHYTPFNDSSFNAHDDFYQKYPPQTCYKWNINVILEWLNYLSLYQLVKHIRRNQSCTKINGKHLLDFKINENSTSHKDSLISQIYSLFLFNHSKICNQDSPSSSSFPMTMDTDTTSDSKTSSPSSNFLKADSSDQVSMDDASLDSLKLTSFELRNFSSQVQYLQQYHFVYFGSQKSNGLKTTIKNKLLESTKPSISHSKLKSLTRFIADTKNRHCLLQRHFILCFSNNVLTIFQKIGLDVKKDSVLENNLYFNKFFKCFLKSISTFFFLQLILIRYPQYKKGL
ncbi:hypothetical protein RFI_21575 [Reticulomyxa filosa]|uniref:Uncharacterized protein n=1 Tax=Reticulomyxa filosa TaxID=46433 RepID=X6MPL0_RETFI|nr:hypothetical protein RFI_21575 [Reticulomyxa filosa]|eukprot:ETO15794.1 hypothetical protein RFI_21575 [Reticulomyxa filosa]